MLEPLKPIQKAEVASEIKTAPAAATKHGNFATNQRRIMLFFAIWR
jgi:hypothetical protein